MVRVELQEERSLSPLSMHQVLFLRVRSRSPTKGQQGTKLIFISTLGPSGTKLISISTLGPS